MHEHGGTIPADPAAVGALPGVGRYIAGAILSFAFDLPEPIVEANSQRVLARLLAIEDDLKSALSHCRRVLNKDSPLLSAANWRKLTVTLSEPTETPVRIVFHRHGTELQ